MTQPTDDLTALATPYALHAIPESERADIDRRIAAAPPEVAQAFADEVRAVRETMAVISAATAVEPPHELRDRVLAGIEHRRRLSRCGRKHQALAGDGVWPPRPRWSSDSARSGSGSALRPAPTVSTAEQVFAAPDVRTISGEIPGGGTATVVFSREKDAGVLVMNNVTPPKTGTVYQMWLINDDGPHSAGTMDAQAVAPSTTAVLPDLDGSSTLAFTDRTARRFDSSRPLSRSRHCH